MAGGRPDARSAWVSLGRRAFLGGVATRPDPRGTAWGALAGALLVGHLLAFWGLLRYTSVEAGRTAGDPVTPLTEPLLYTGAALLLTLSADAWLVVRDARELRRGLPVAASPADLLHLAGRGWVACEAAWLLAYAGTLAVLCHQGPGPRFLLVVAVAVPALAVLLRQLAAAAVRRRPPGPPVDSPRVRRLARGLVSGTFRATSPLLFLVLLAPPGVTSPWDDVLFALLAVRFAWAALAAVTTSAPTTGA
jgi:hypothetical protein